jgi:hypothetical protein
MEFVHVGHILYFCQVKIKNDASFHHLKALQLFRPQAILLLDEVMICFYFKIPLLTFSFKLLHLNFHARHCIQYTAIFSQ